jgi:hypothetical protein
MTAEADSVAPGVLIDWDAKTEIGDSTPLVWEYQTGGSLANPLNYDAYSGSPTLLTEGDPGFATSRPGIEAAFLFDGIDDKFRTQSAAGGGNTFYDLDGGPTDGNATIEIWIRPVDLVNLQSLWEAGGNIIGSGIYLNGTDLFFRVRDEDWYATSPTFDLSATSDFVQVVGGFDVAGDKIYLYVNGTATATGGTPLTAFAEWAHDDRGEGDGLGATAGASAGGSVGGDLAPARRFTGQIAIVRFYDRLLSPQEVLGNYNAVALPEPSALALLGIAGVALLVCVARRRKRPAG